VSERLQVRAELVKLSRLLDVDVSELAAILGDDEPAL